MTDTKSIDLLPPPTSEGEVGPFMERHRVDPKAVALIRANSPSLSDADLGRLLEVAAHLQLNPLLGEIYAARGKGKDGKPGRLLFMVGRDGLLKNARRHSDYLGFDADVIREKDTFEVVRQPDGHRAIHHAYNGAPSDRGEIKGAWAEVRRKGKAPTFFVAPMEEYRPRAAREDSTWQKQPSVMIQKCAVSLCHRLAFSLAGVVSEEEGARMLEEDGDERVPEKETLSTLMATLEPDLRDRLAQAYERAASLRPGQVTAAAVEMYVKDQPREAVLRYIEALEAENAEVVDATAEEEEDHLAAGISRRDDLRSQLDAAEPGSDEAAQLAEELDAVESDIADVVQTSTEEG